MTNHADLIAQLNNGWVARPKRWRGDTHHDFPYGNLDDKATDLLMEEAADALEAAQAEIDRQDLEYAARGLLLIDTERERDKALARIAKLQPKRNVSPPSEELVLHKMRYHFWEADDDEPADFELFDAGVECDTCIDVALVRQDRLDELIAALARLAVVEEANSILLGRNKWLEHVLAAQPSQADAQDAARYRWLRMNLDDSIVMHGDVSEAQLMGEEELDAAIDAAINAKGNT